MQKPLIGLIAILLTCTAAPAQDIGWNAAGKQGAVAAGGKEAVAAGLAALQKGGNAVDGAAATIFALSVTDSTNFCFGGEVPIMVYDAKRNVTELLCGLGAAPKLATQEFFAKRKGSIPAKGIEAAAVPGMVDGVLTALDRYGTITFADSRHASNWRLLDHHKKPWHARLEHRTIRRMIDAEKRRARPASAACGWSPNEFYRRLDCPRACRLVQRQRRSDPLHRPGDACHARRGSAVGRLSRAHRLQVRRHRGQGPYLLEALQLLEGFDLKAMGHNRPDTVHVMTEAMKLALADRDVYYADPLFAEVPLTQLLSTQYANVRRPLIDMKKASQVRPAGRST